MNVRKDLCLAVCLALILASGASLANAQITFTCDPSVATATCNYLNTAISGHYSSTFANANANIYITYGATDLGASVHGENTIPYSQYVTALTANTAPSPVQTAALSALNTYDAGPYGNSSVQITSALGSAFGLTGLQGVNTSDFSCDLGTPGCYDGVITMTNSSSITWYYLDQGGIEPVGAYDFYATVEHEADEVLGTSSCIRTASSENPAAAGRNEHIVTVIRPKGADSLATAATTATLTDDCGAGMPSAVDLYRYSASGALVLDSSLSTKDGAYFSYDGGSTDGADGVDGSKKHYNAKANGDDYADFVASADCSKEEAVQDATGCPGQDAGISILNDGRGEINILNAVGFNLVSSPPQSVISNKNLVDFGNVDYPASSAKQDGLDLENDGSVPAAIGSISIVATYGDASQFTFVDSSKCAAGTLDPGKKCHIDLFFNPDAVTVSRATLQIPVSPGSTISVALTGAGVNSGTQ